MGRSSLRASASASGPQGCQSTGLLACCSRYRLLSRARRLVWDMMQPRRETGRGYDMKMLCRLAASRRRWGTDAVASGSPLKGSEIIRLAFDGHGRGEVVQVRFQYELVS